MIAELPAWLLNLLRPAVANRPALGAYRRPLLDGNAYAVATFDQELATLRDAPVGQRNHTLNRVAFVLGRLVGGGYLDAETVARALLDMAATIGLSEHEAVRTIRSGLHAGAQQPRRIP